MSKRLTHIIIIVSSILLGFSSCISSEESNYLQNIDTEYTFKAYTEYKLATGDFVTCLITTGDKEFARTFNGLVATGGLQQKSFQVYEDGSIHLPYFGAISVAGLTVQEAEKKIQREMQESIIDAQVHVSFSSNVFYVLAEGKRGAHLVYKDNLTIYQALAISGKTTDKMDLSKVSIIRKQENGATETKTFDLRSRDVVESDYYYVKPNDVIYFPTNKHAFFSISSIGEFVTAITVPLSFLIFVSTYRF